MDTPNQTPPAVESAKTPAAAVSPKPAPKPKKEKDELEMLDEALEAFELDEEHVASQRTGPSGKLIIATHGGRKLVYPDDADRIALFRKNPKAANALRPLRPADKDGVPRDRDGQILAEKNDDGIFVLKPRLAAPVEE